MVAHTGLEPVISALRGQRVNQLHQCAAIDFRDYRGRLSGVASQFAKESVSTDYIAKSADQLSSLCHFRNRDTCHGASVRTRLGLSV